MNGFASFQTVTFLGIPIHDLTMRDTLIRLEQMIARKRFHQVATANLNFVRNASSNPSLMRILRRCDLVLPDGMPLVWASGLLGKRLQQRVTGADLVPTLAQQSAEKGWKIFLLGSTEETTLRAMAWMKEESPGVKFTGYLCPPISPIDDMANDEIVETINTSGSDILLVSFGNPKQEEWLARFGSRLKVSVGIGIGGALGFIGGFESRAPEWMQKSGLEWAHRLAQSPKRLAERYLKDASTLIGPLPRQIAAQRLQTGDKKVGILLISQAQIGMIAKIIGTLDASVGNDLRSVVREGMDKKVWVFVDLQQANHISNESLGLLQDAHRNLVNAGTGLVLTGVSSRVYRYLRLCGLTGSFPMPTESLYLLQKRGLDPATEYAAFRLPPVDRRRRNSPPRAMNERRKNPVPADIPGWTSQGVEAR